MKSKDVRAGIENSRDRRPIGTEVVIFISNPLHLASFRHSQAPPVPMQVQRSLALLLIFVDLERDRQRKRLRRMMLINKRKTEYLKQ